MGLLVQTTDFTGKFRIGQNCYTELSDYIDKYEPQVLQDLLGCDLYDLFAADVVDFVPVTARFLDLYNPFCIDDGSCIYRSEGMKDMVLGVIYFYFVRDLEPKVTTGGVKLNKVETSDKAEFGKHDIYSRYNESIESYQAIRWYICENSADYTEENSQPKDYVGKI